MADPVTIGLIAMGATAAGGAVKAGGQLFEGAAKANLDNYQSQIAMMNAKIAWQDAQYAIHSGGIEAQQVGYKTADEVARTKVGFAAGDVAPGTGTAGKVISSEIAIGRQSEGIVTANAAKRAYGFEVATAQDLAQANIYQTAAKYDRTASYIGATSTVLGTVGQVSSQYLAGRPSGSGVYSS